MRKFKTLFLLLFLLVTVCSQAQVKWGVKAGWNMSAALIKDDYGYTKVKLRPGFNIGGTADLPISEKVFVQPALLFTTKGFGMDQASGNTYLEGLDKIHFTPYYLELPINLVYRPRIGGTHMLLGIGPYIGYGIGGRWKAESDNISVKGTLKFMNDYSSMDSSFGGDSRKAPYLKPFDFGGNFLIGVEITPKLYVQLQGQMGLINLEPTINGMRDEKSSTRNVGGGLSVGYKF